MCHLLLGQGRGQLGGGGGGGDQKIEAAGVTNEQLYATVCLPIGNKDTQPKILCALAQRSMKCVILFSWPQNSSISVLFTMHANVSVQV